MERKRLEIDKKYVKNIAMAVGKDEVGGSNPPSSSTIANPFLRKGLAFFIP